MVTTLPDAPPLGDPRLASPSGIMRLGIVATAGFKYSPLFRWERPYHAQFPSDTLLSYRTNYSNAIEDEQSIVLVVEDGFMPDENHYTEAVILPENGWEEPKEGDKVVVGIASFKLEPGSRRKGTFQSDEGTFPDLPKYEGKDLNRKHYESRIKLENEALGKHCYGDSEMCTLVVHPAYWKKGHGTKLVKWGMELCNIDQVTQGVSAADMGEKLYSKLGYETICNIEGEGDEDDPEGMSTALMEYYSQ